MFQEVSCDVSVAAGEADRQEFSFTLYDFDGHGKVTKDVSFMSLLPVGLFQLLRDLDSHQVPAFSFNETKRIINLKLGTFLNVVYVLF